MKKILFCLFLLVLNLKTFGQVKPLNIDKYVSVNLPGKVEKLDTVVEGLPLIQLYSVVDNTVYLISKVKINKEANFKGLPYDEGSLYKVYNEGAEGVVDGMEARDHEVLSTSKITIGKFKGFLMKIKAKTGKAKTGEVKSVVLGEYLYMVVYINTVDFNEKDKDAFLGSIMVNPESPSQFLGTQPGFEMSKASWKLLLGVFTILVLWFLSKKLKKNKKDAEARVKSDV